MFTKRSRDQSLPSSEKNSLFKFNVNLNSSQEQFISTSSEFLNEYKKDCKLKPIRNTGNFFEADTQNELEMLFSQSHR